ncbi:MAG: phosphoadenosine phosphosulfate reductase family protein [Thermoguttaceae bacterium]|nr:phosphoadenosine phosphosulfate reductase family protein [Thermoguttaceae bacterium]
MKQVISFSGGKDSTALLHLMLERGEQIDEVIYFNGGWEWPQTRRTSFSRNVAKNARNGS